MNDFSSGGPRGPDRPLSASTRDGKPYQRAESVEAAIARAMGLHESELIAQKEELPGEVLVFLMRKTYCANKRLFGELLVELNKRIVRIGGAFVRGFDEITKEEILWKVQKDILDLVTAEKSSRRSDILEVAFGQAVKRRTLDAAEKYKNSPLGRRGEIVVHDPDAAGDDEEIQRPIELAADSRPHPEAILLKSEDQDLLRKSSKKARRAVKDPREREAVFLYHGEGWTIEDLVRHFNATPRQIKYLLARGMKAMRKAMGGQ